MYRLLIIDDEPYTVDGLYEMLQEVLDLELDVYRAYSPEEAMEWLTRTKIDIVLSDIRMPGMSGLELQQWVHEQWPRCKIIFLTGMRDIQLAQQAIRSGTVNYILKTEGDEEILRSIRQAIALLSEEVYREQLMTKAKDQLRHTLPLLQREWFLGLLTPGIRSRNLQASRLRELEIEADPEADVFPVVGRIDQWSESDSPADQTLFLYAVQNIASEYMETVHLTPVILDGSHFVWLIQPKDRDETGNTKQTQWRKTVSFVQGMLENVQQTCRNLLNLPLSLISWKLEVSWEELPQAYNQMKKTLVLGVGNGKEMLLTAHYEMNIGDFGEISHDYSSRFASTLAILLEGGYEDEFRRQLTEQFAELPGNYFAYMRMYYSVALLLLEHLGSLSLRDADLVLGALMNLDTHQTKEQALNYLWETASVLFQRHRQVQDECTNRLVTKLHRYIQDHLTSDLSLTVLAELVFLNPSYLSVLYKQHTGRNISDYIAEVRLNKAKELLEKSHLKIHEIAEKIGFETAGYFTRFFKKHTTLTPLEYRNR